MIRSVIAVAAEGEHRGLFGMMCHGGVLVVVWRLRRLLAVVRWCAVMMVVDQECNDGSEAVRESLHSLEVRIKVLAAWIGWLLILSRSRVKLKLTWPREDIRRRRPPSTQFDIQKLQQLRETEGSGIDI